MLRSLSALLILVFSSLLTGCSQAPVPPPVDTPAQVVGKFYRACIDDKITGAPTAEQLTKLAPYLTTELRALLEKARQLHDSEAKKYPDEKPPFTEGDLFTSLFEGPATFQAGASEAVASGYRVKVQFRDSATQPTTNWTDTVILIQQDHQSKIADVEYGGTWDFGNKGTLLESLKSGLADAAAGAPNAPRRAAGSAGSSR